MTIGVVGLGYVGLPLAVEFAEAGEQVVSAWADHDRDQAVERGIDVDGYVADVAAATDELRRTWRGLADRFAALVKDPVPEP